MWIPESESSRRVNLCCMKFARTVVPSSYLGPIVVKRLVSVER